jgi:hypothetical protein
MIESLLQSSPPPAASSRWKTIPIFISSTFRDMHAERDRLNNVVFPELEDRLGERRCRLEPIDLRVGVETGAAQSERERYPPAARAGRGRSRGLGPNGGGASLARA